MQTHRRTSTASAALLLLLWTPAVAQVPGTRTLVEVAEVRGLAAVPTDAVSEFEKATPGPSFEPSIRAVLVRFRSATPIVDSNLAIIWASAPDSGTPTELRRVEVDPTRLVSGVTEAMTASGQPIARGRYRVSLVGASNRYYRSVAFSVGVRSDHGTGSRVPRSKAYFDQYSLLYPTSYTPQQTVAGMTGVLLIRRAPFTLMFAALSDEGSNTVLPQGRRIIEFWLARLDSLLKVEDVQATDIPASELGPGMTFGKAVNVRLARGLFARANLYSKMVDGRKVLVGYAMLGGEGVPVDYQHFITTDPGATADEFFDMAESLAGGTPWGARSPGERPRQ